MHSSFHRLALAVLLAGSASLAPLLNAGAAPAAPRKNAPPAAPAVTHGMLAALLAGTGNYGQPLISGCAWATWVTNCQNLTAYGNGSSFDDVGCGTPNGCKFGSEFQCSELAQRYAYYAWGEPATW